MSFSAFVPAGRAGPLALVWGCCPAAGPTRAANPTRANSVRQNECMTRLREAGGSGQEVYRPGPVAAREKRGKQVLHDRGRVLIIRGERGIGISAVPSLPKAVRRVRLPYPALRQRERPGEPAGASFVSGASPDATCG